jgi:hypothetical protein
VTAGRLARTAAVCPAVAASAPDVIVSSVRPSMGYERHSLGLGQTRGDTHPTSVYVTGSEVETHVTSSSTSTP